jgi:glyoxylase-like metal-dependent hydrolase (beta-lactamase superfamily II)
VTELDLIALGIWWIPIPLPGARGRESVNAWAIEDIDGGVALFDCGHGAPESLAAIVRGLAEAGSTLDDVQRIVISHAHLEHCGGAHRILGTARREVSVFASAAEGSELRSALYRLHVLRDGDRFQFRHFGASAVALPGHTAGLTGLFDEEHGILFSSDHLVHGFAPCATVGPAWDAGDHEPVDAYRRSLRRVARLDARVVLPGRGAPFAGHRRVVREILGTLAVIPSRAAVTTAPAGATDAAHTLS